MKLFPPKSKGNIGNNYFGVGVIESTPEHMSSENVTAALTTTLLRLRIEKIMPKVREYASDCSSFLPKKELWAINVISGLQIIFLLIKMKAILSTKWAHKFWFSKIVIWADRKY